jgi:O-antigen/teichoic acid export membrane protein
MDIKRSAKKLAEQGRQVFQSAGAGHASWMMGSSGLKAVVAFGGNLLLVRLLRPEDFGRFAIIQANVGLVAAIINFRINDLVLRAPEEELDQEHLSLYSGALVIQTVLVGGGALVVLWVLGMLNIEAGILLASSLVTTWLTFQLKLYEREFEYKRISWIETGAHFAAHAFAVSGAFAGLGGLVLYLRNAVQVGGKFAGLHWAGALQRIPMRWLDVNDLKRVFRQIRGFWVDGLLESSYRRVVVVLLGALAGDAVTGYYYQARRLASVPHQLLQPVTARIAFNYFSHQIPPERKRSMLAKSMTGVGLLLAVICVGTVLLADPIIPWVFGRGWEPVVPMLIAMQGFLVGTTLFNLLKAYFMAEAQMRPLIICGRGGQYAALGVAALLVHLAVLEPGIGIALGLSASYLVGTALLMIVAMTSSVRLLYRHQRV